MSRLLCLSRLQKRARPTMTHPPCFRRAIANQSRALLADRGGCFREAVHVVRATNPKEAWLFADALSEGAQNTSAPAPRSQNPALLQCPDMELRSSTRGMHGNLQEGSEGVSR